MSDCGGGALGYIDRVCWLMRLKVSPEPTEPCGDIDEVVHLNLSLSLIGCNSY